MEDLVPLNSEIEPVRWVMEMPHNTCTKLYRFLGLEPDLRFGTGCLDKAFWTQEVLGGYILFDPYRNHFANLLENGRIFDPSARMLEAITSGVVGTLDPTINIEIQRKPNGEYRIISFSGSSYSKGFRMYPFDGDYQDGLDLMYQGFSVDDYATLHWPHRGKFTRICYGPKDDNLFYDALPEHNRVRLASAADYCGATSREILDYFDYANNLLQSYRPN